MENINSKPGIVCRGVPAECNNKEFMTIHFNNYGVVKRVYCNPRKESTTVYFEKYDQADSALHNGIILKPNLPPIQTFWISQSLKCRKKQGKESKQSGLDLKSVTKEIKFPNSEVDDELASMQGSSDTKTGLSTIFIERSSEYVKTHEEIGCGGIESSTCISTHKQDDASPSLNTGVSCTAENCFGILNDCDKILKASLGLPKLAEGAIDISIKGTCRDMCPEKERYMREYRRHLSVYEIIPGTDLPGEYPQVDHSRAVKEYSRSSADQDMPLPHELRPPDVLQMTMEYLIKDIIPLGGDGKWADWYEFMWNRTRSIRKDITQQQLCDMTAVSVIEKIVRFHIFCAERLCEEDMICFDQKINNENMTKCLQTLKEMYHDLDKKGCYCPHEAEFRAYMVLMNLNQGDTLREVQQLKVKLRLSEPVRLATAVHSAVNTNNYIRFFKLVRNAPFLYCCILHRYFGQVRTKALHTIVKVYRGAGPVSEYPLLELVQSLAFENKSDAAHFCQHHGLNVTNDYVVIDKARFIFPEEVLDKRRAVNVIESKLITSVSEAINCGPLLVKKIHKPVLSFDENGRFIGQMTEVIQQPTNFEEDVFKKQTEKMSDLPIRSSVKLFPIEAIKEVAKDLLDEVIKEQLMIISRTIHHQIQISMGNDLIICEELERAVIFDEVRKLCSEVCDECRHKAELLSLHTAATCRTADVLVNNVVLEMCRDMAVNEIRESLNAITQSTERRVTSDIALTLLDETIQEEICLVAEDIFESDVIRRQQVLDKAQYATQMTIKARFFKQWQNQYAARVRLKYSIQTFPSGPSLNPPHSQVKSILPSSHGISNSTLHLGDNALATLDSSTGVQEKQTQFKADVLFKSHQHAQRQKEAWIPFNLADAFYERLLRRIQRQNDSSSVGTVYWKLTLSLPDVGPDSSLDDDYAQKTINTCDWLRSKFKKGTVPTTDPESKTELLALYTTPIRLSAASKGNLGVCIRVLRGFPEEEEYNTIDRHHMLGTSAILFYVGDVGPDNKECYHSEVLSRLQHVLESLPKCPPVPLIVLTSPNSPVTSESDLNLHVFVEEGMISHYCLLELKRLDGESCSKEVYDRLLWAAELYPSPPRLLSETLRNTVENTLLQDYMMPVYQTMTEQPYFNPIQSNPHLLVALYNDIISHISDIVTHVTLQDMSWPVIEFSPYVSNLPSAHWNTYSQFETIRLRLLELQLPSKNHLDDAAVDWPCLVDDVWAYVFAVIEDRQNNMQLFSRVRRLLHKAEHRFLMSRKQHSETSSDVSQQTFIPWTDIVHACIESRLSQANWFDEQTGEELMTYYVPSKHTNYTPIKEWMEFLLDIEEKWKSFSHGTHERCNKRKHNAFDKMPSKIPKIADSFHLEISQLPEGQWEAAHNLQTLIAAEKQDNSVYEENLQTCLTKDDCLDSHIMREPVFHHLMEARNFSSSKNKTCQKDQTMHLEGSPASLQISAPSISTGTDIPSKSTSLSLTADIDELKLSLDSMRQSNVIYEMKLDSLLKNF